MKRPHIVPPDGESELSTDVTVAVTVLVLVQTLKPTACISTKVTRRNTDCIAGNITKPTSIAAEGPRTPSLLVGPWVFLSW